MSKTSFVISVVLLVIILVIGIVILFSGNEKENLDAKNKPAPTTTSTPSVTDTPVAPSGFKIEVLKEGTGTKVTKAGDTISVHYTGTLENGAKFDSSLDRKEPFQFNLGAGRVIKGWDQGLIGMKVGEKRKLTIPPSLGYGDQAMGEKIPANSTLIFEVELLEII
jgi:peptidylprolyl isomerase